MQNGARDRRHTLQADAILAKPHAFTFKCLNRTAEHLILRRNDAVAGDLPAAQHIARQSGTIS